MSGSGLSVALAALCFGACAAPSAPTAPQTTPGSDANPAQPGKPADPARVSYRQNLERAQDDAGRAGWLLQDVIEIPGHNAALVRYRSANARRASRIDAVGAGAYHVLSNQSGMIDVMRAPGGALTWDLRGDGSTSVVIDLTPCGASCGVAKPLVLELRQDQFVVPASAPECPTCLHDADHDGVPEFEHSLVKLVVAPCSRVSCGPSAELRVEVRGLESWDGAKYAQDLASFQPLYFELLKQTRSEEEGVRRAGGKAKICPLGALEVAAELVVYSRLIGESRRDALAQADEVMRGYDTGPCAKEYDLLAPPKAWGELRQELEAVEVPTLGRSVPRPTSARH